MSQLTSPKYLKDLLARHGFQFTKSLGQNFLIDQNILNKIVEAAGIQAEDKVLEVGPGVGTLTQALAKRAARVVSVELDKALLPILQETLRSFSNVKIIHGDILKLNIHDLIRDEFQDKPVKVVANLPYYITTPIIMRFLEEDHPYNSITVMVQREVADRIAARPGSKEYGALSVAVQFYTQPRIIGKVPSGVFMPPPKVDSMIITLKKRSRPAAEVKDPNQFFRVVKTVFSQRRKTLLNTLASAEWSNMDKPAWKETLLQLNIDPQRRGETLTLEELAAIANCFR